MHHWSGVFRLLLNILFGGRICPNINIAAFNLISLRRHAVAFVLPNFIEICGAKNFKIRNQIFKKKCIFKSVPCPTNHRGHIGAQLHSFCYRKEQTVALKFYKNLIDMDCTQWPLSHFFFTALKSLTNYSAAMKSFIRKILYTCTSTITILIGCCGFFAQPDFKNNNNSIIVMIIIQ